MDIKCFGEEPILVICQIFGYNDNKEALTEMIFYKLLESEKQDLDDQDAYEDIASTPIQEKAKMKPTGVAKLNNPNFSKKFTEEILDFKLEEVFKINSGIKSSALLNVNLFTFRDLYNHEKLGIVFCDNASNYRLSIYEVQLFARTLEQLFSQDYFHQRPLMNVYVKDNDRILTCSSDDDLINILIMNYW